MSFDDTDEIKMIENEISDISHDLINSYGTDKELELQHKLKILLKRKSKLLRRRN